MPEWPIGPDCKSGGSAFGGSNPSLPTILVDERSPQNPTPALAATLVVVPARVFWVSKFRVPVLLLAGSGLLYRYADPVLTQTLRLRRITAGVVQW